MYESVKKEIMEAVSRKAAELGKEIEGILMHQVGEMMREVMMSGLEGEAPKKCCYAGLNKGLKSRSKGLEQLGPLPAPGTATRAVYDYVLEHGPCRPSEVVKGCKGALTAKALYSLTRSLRNRGFFVRKNGKYSAVR